jgi:hypothetical protein
MTSPSSPPNRRRRRIVVAVAALVLGLGWWQFSGSELESNAKTIRAGMTRQQVLGLLGDPVVEGDCSYSRRADDIRVWDYLAFRSPGYNIPARLHELLWKRFPSASRVFGISCPNPSSLFSVHVYLNRENQIVEMVRIREVEQW